MINRKTSWTGVQVFKGIGGAKYRTEKIWIFHEWLLPLGGKHLAVRIGLLEVDISAAVIQMSMSIYDIFELKLVFFQCLINHLCLVFVKAGIDQETVIVCQRINTNISRIFNIIGFSCYSDHIQ
mgnify:CR=1 FL=1